jgi:hypothetical protein
LGRPFDYTILGTASFFLFLGGGLFSFFSEEPMSKDIEHGFFVFGFFDDSFSSHLLFLFYVTIVD